jgi:hypothetical protein
VKEAKHQAARGLASIPPKQNNIKEQGREWLAMLL